MIYYEISFNYRIERWKDEKNSDIDMRDSDARKMFVKLKSKYKGTGALMQMLVFRDGKWCGFLKN